MNNLKKIGLTALAGSLVSFGVNAAEMTVSGGAKVTYVTESGDSDSNKGNVTGSPLGFEQMLAFNGSAENPIGDISLYIGFDMTGVAKSSSALTIDMGDNGIVAFDGGTAGYGMNNKKDTLPRASGAEQSWDDTKGDAYTTGEATTGMIAYRNSVAGMNYDVVYAKNGGGNSNDDTQTAAGDDSSKTLTVWSDTLMDGMQLGAGYGKIDDTTSIDIEKQATVWAKYAVGSVTLGVQLADHNKAADDESIMMYGVAFNLNENASISYNKREVELGDQINGAQSDHEDTGIAASYTMGGMTLSAFQNEAENVAGTAGVNDKRTQVSLSFAF
jgi:outer membrane protein OmpU|tara:strand:- start:158 stop:1144 length:987 start_codon:yes stop_codon:yes gene_type:complete